MNFRDVADGLRRIGPRDDEQSRNYWNLYIEIGFYGFLFGVLQTFLNVYALRLGASNEVMGWLAATPSLVFAVGAIPAAAIIERVTRRLRLIVVTALLHRLGVLALAAMPFFLTSFRPEAVVVIVTLMSFPQIVANIAFAAMYADVVPAEHRSRVVALRNIVLGFTSTIASLGGGIFLGLASGTFGAALAPLFEFPLNFQAVFFAAFLSSLLSAVYLGRVRPPPETAPAPQAAAHLRLRLLPALLRRAPVFNRYTFGMFVMHWGLFLPMPLFSIYWVRSLHASDTFIGAIITVQSLVSMIAFVFLPRLAARIGNLGVLSLALLLSVLYPLLTAFTVTLEPLLAVAAIGGVSNAMLGLGSFNLLLEVTPAEQRATYIAVYNSALFSAGFFAPFLGTALLGVMGIGDDLLLSAAVRFAGFLAVFLLVHSSGKAAS